MVLTCQITINEIQHKLDLAESKNRNYDLLEEKFRLKLAITRWTYGARL